MSSVGVAAAALQFFGAAFKAAVLCKQIFESEKSATDHNAALETFITYIHESREKLARDPAAGTSQAVLDVVHQYDPLAVKLLEVLGYIHGVGEDIGLAGKTDRAWRKEKMVENLENSIKHNMQALEQLLVIETW